MRTDYYSARGGVLDYSQRKRSTTKSEPSYGSVSETVWIAVRDN